MLSKVTWRDNIILLAPKEECFSPPLTVRVFIAFVDDQNSDTFLKKLWKKGVSREKKSNTFVVDKEKQMNLMKQRTFEDFNEDE